MKESTNKNIIESNVSLFNKNSNLLNIFDEVCSRLPNKEMVQCNKYVFNYQKIFNYSFELSLVIQNLESKNKKLIGIFLQRSSLFILSMLGIIRSGAGYLPLDIEYPIDRLEYIINNSDLKILVTERSLVKKINNISKNLKIICIDEIIENTSIHKDISYNYFKKIISSDALAYVIYTSGTTGAPKGIMIQHSSLINLVNWHLEYYQIDNNDKTAVYSSFSFDASIWEIWPYLLNGNKLYILDNDIKYNIDELNKYYHDNGITIAFLPTAICEEFFKLKNDSLRVLLTGGDKLCKLPFFKNISYSLYNNYGPTECTVVATSTKIESDSDPSVIGKAIGCTSIYLLKDNSAIINSNDINTIGEIYIGGQGLAMGYINNRELTDKKFIYNILGERLYKTGDLGCYTSSGEIKFIGRVDNQVQINGYRVEINEIESIINNYEGVDDSIVLYIDKGEIKYLVAYYKITNESINISLKNLVNYLKKKLATFMVPSKFFLVNDFPITINGKKDKKALKKVFYQHLSDSQNLNIDNNISKTEKKLIEIWCNILKVPSISIKSNLFELGINSLLIIQVIQSIKIILKKRVKFQDLFQKATIQEQAKIIDDNIDYEKDDCNIKYQDGLLPIQEQILTLSESLDNAPYNIPLAWDIYGDLNVDHLRLSFLKLIKKHHYLRGEFFYKEGKFNSKIINTKELQVRLPTAMVA